MDILPDIEDLLNSLAESETRIETRRSGPFTFRLGVDGAALAPLYQRVLDAHERLNASPLSQVARQLEREVVASSIFGTNSIEGGTLTEEETDAFRTALEPVVQRWIDEVSGQGIDGAALVEKARAAIASHKSGE